MSYLGPQNYAINPAAPTEELGAYPRYGGAVTADVPTEQIFKWLMVTGAGSVVVQGPDGSSYTLPALQPGVQYRALGRMVVGSGTTATGIFWLGGK